MNKLSRASVFWFVAVLAMVVVFIGYSPNRDAGKAVSFAEFTSEVQQGRVKEVTFKGQTISGEYTDGSRFTSVGPPEAGGWVYNDLVENGVVPSFEEAEDENLLLTGLFTFLPLIAMVVLLFWFMRSLQGTNGRAMNFGKAKAKLQSENNRRITFEDVAGIDECKDELQEIIDFLKDPRKFTRLGGRIPKGVLLMGPPGTGKTLLARAVAGEAGVPFFSISGSDFVEMFVGVGASRVRDLFDQGKKQAPCIIFIDEIDAVGRQRGAGLGGGNDEREQTLNQLLVEMDGFEGTEGIIIIAATNRPDVLDPALLRPGRFDRRIIVPNPDVRGRKDILEIHTRRIPLEDGVDLGVLAKGTPGFSGADLENLCNEAALLAARLDKTQVEMTDLLEAREKIVMGPERRSLVMPEWEKKNTAYHEAGHAIVAHLLPDHDPVHKITIVPRGKALGITWTLPNEDRLSETRESLLKRISMMMGGRAAEEVALQTMSGGASNDIERATQIARQMVCELGMSKQMGPVTWGERSGEVFLGRQMGRTQSYSDETARRIDHEVKSILERTYDAAVLILTANIHVLHSVAQRLIERESLDHDEFAELVDEAGPVIPDGLGWMGV